MRPPGWLTLIFQIQLDLLFSSYVTLNTFSSVTDINSASRSLEQDIQLCLILITRKVPKQEEAMHIQYYGNYFHFQRERPCDKVTRAIVQVKSQPSKQRLAADVMPSSAAFNASNSLIQLQKISRAICEFKPNKVQKVEVCFMRRCEISSARAHLYSCVFAVVVMSGELDQAEGEKKRKKEGENTVQIMRELLGLK